MAEEISYHDGDIVWVKMNKLWWPGEVHGTHRLPSDFFDQFKKPPLVVVKFFQEENYHYVNQLHQIARFNCVKKNEYIKKGLDLYYAKHTYMTEFPADVAIAEKKTGGNPSIIYSKEFMPSVKLDKTTPSASLSKGSTSRSRRGQQIQANTPSIPRVMIKPDHDTRILVPSGPSTLTSSSSSSSTTPTVVDSKYKCTLCNYSTNRINTFVWHQKTHNTPKTPQASTTTTTPKCPIKQTPSKTFETKSFDPPMVNSAKVESPGENIPEIDEQLKPVDKVTEPTNKQQHSINKEASEPVPTKSKAKRGRRSIEPKVTEKLPKTDNKLKKILDEWSDDEIGGETGLTSEKLQNIKCASNTDDEECSTKKKLKFDNEQDGTSVHVDLNSLTASVADDDKKNVKHEPFAGQSVEHQTSNTVRNDDVKPHTRSSLRSGRTMLTSEKSPSITPIKRRGRSKRNANDSLQSEPDVLEIKVDDVPVLPSGKNETQEASATEEVAVESVDPPAKEVNKSNSKTSRKGKPRRKEEIKLANNISVAVLVEKTSPCPATDNGIVEKVDVIPAAPDDDDKEYTNVVHKKIRYMSHSSSTDDQRKSIESIEEVAKLPEPINESENQIDDRTDAEPVNNQNAEVNAEIPAVSDQEEKQQEEIDLNNSGTTTDVTEKINENLAIIETPNDRRVVIPKCYERKSTPKKKLSTDKLDAPSVTSVDDAIEEDFQSPSSSNLRQRAPKRYENTRNRRKSDRRTESNDDDDDFTAMVKDDNYDETNQKSVELNNSSSGEKNDSKLLSEVLNGSGKDNVDSTNPFDQSSDTSSKLSTPEKTATDTSKDLDCFDFTEDECLKPPQVLNRRKRLPPGKVFELDDIDKIEEQKKMDEEVARMAQQQREEENDKLHAELENLLNSTTPVTLPEIPLVPKVQENFPERRAEKDPEKISIKDSESNTKDRTSSSSSSSLPPKERNKRIFKYRNRNRRPDSDPKLGNCCDVEENNKVNDSLQPVCSDENADASVTTSAVVNEMEVDMEKVQSNDHVSSETDRTDVNPSAHDLKIEIAETLISFPLLSPQAAIVAKPSNKRKESSKTTKSVKKLRNTPHVEHPSKIELCDEETSTTTTTIANNDFMASIVQQEPTTKVAPPNYDNFELQSIKKTADTTDTASSSVRDFNRIRQTEKIDSGHSPSPTVFECFDETAAPKTITHQLPLKKTVALTQTECKNVITRIPKKRKSHMDDDDDNGVPEERAKDHPENTPESITIDHSLVNKEPTTFIVTKTVKKQQIIGELTKQNLVGVESPTVENQGIGCSDEQGSNTNIVRFSQPVTAEKRSKSESPVVVNATTSHLIIQKKSTKNLQKRTTTVSTTTSTSTTIAANVLGNLSANRPCTIAPAKKAPTGATYRRPADMTGSTEKQIGIDGNGNPVIAYEPIASTSSHQLVNPGNQFVITSKGALITNKPFITTTHSTTQISQQPTLTNPNVRSSIHTQQPSSIRSPHPQQQVFHIQQQQKHHPSPQSNQIIIQTKPPPPPTNSISQISSIAPPTGGKKKQATNRRSTANKTKVNEIDRKSSSSGYAPPVPPLVPLNDQFTSNMSSRKQVTKQQQSITQMTLIQEPPIQQQSSKTLHVDVVEQQQENIQEILALPGDTPGFGGPPGSYFLCKLNEMGVYVPIDRQPLYLDVTDNTNLLKPNAPDEAVVVAAMDDVSQIPGQSQSLYELNNESERTSQAAASALSDHDANNPKYLINISDGQQLLVDQQSLMALANGEEFPQFVTSDGHQIILQSGQHDILSAIAFAEDVGLIAGQQILIPEDDLAVIQQGQGGGGGGSHDILAAALAGTETVSFSHPEQIVDNVFIQSSNGLVDDPTMTTYHTLPQPPTNAVTNETNAVLTQPPIMSTLEQPTKKTDRALEHQNLDESLAVIGVTTNVPTSLELPITITNPAIAPKTTTSSIYPPTVTTEHDLMVDYDNIFSSSLPITHHHLTQSLAINENYRTVNVINSIGDIDLDSNNLVTVVATNEQFVERH